MSKRVAERAGIVAGNRLADGEVVLDAVGGRIFLKAMGFSGGAASRIMKARSARAERSELRSRIGDAGLALPDNFTLGVTGQRLLVFVAKPPRNIGALAAEAPLSQIADIRLGDRFALKRAAEIELVGGETFPIELQEPHDPASFVSAFRAAKAAAG